MIFANRGHMMPAWANGEGPVKVFAGGRLVANPHRRDRREPAVNHEHTRHHDEGVTTALPEPNQPA
jgi:hypothetical protein